MNSKYTTPIETLKKDLVNREHTVQRLTSQYEQARMEGDQIMATRDLAKDAVNRLQVAIKALEAIQ